VGTSERILFLILPIAIGQRWAVGNEQWASSLSKLAASSSSC